jgi:hypothetical protein
MNLSIKLGFLFCSLFVFSCVPMQSRLQEVQVPPARIYQKGYSIVPLNESGWYIGQQNQQELAIGKRGEGKNMDETFLVHGILVAIPPYKDSQDFVRIAKDLLSKDADPQRYKMIMNNVTYEKEKGADCARSHVLAEDTAAVKKSGRQGGMMFEILSLTCSHPKNKGVSVNIAYSHRYFPEQKDPKFVEKGTSVLSSIEFDNL